MRISSIDLGSNALRLIIVDVNPASGFKTVKKHRESIRLGEDVFNGRLIQPETQQRLIAAFKRIHKLHRKYKVERYMALATSAFRDAINKKAVVRLIAEKSKIKINVISGQHEADLIRQAVQNSIILTNDPTLLIDIGGGSIELSVLKNNKLTYSRSFKLGMVRVLSEAKKNNLAVEKYLKLKLKKFKKTFPKGPFSLAVGTGGNIDAMARLKLQYLKKAPNVFLYRNEVQTLYTEVRDTLVEDRPKKFQIKADRADVIEPALFLVLTLMKEMKINKIKIPGVGLKEGALLSIL